MNCYTGACVEAQREVIDDGAKILREEGGNMLSFCDMGGSQHKKSSPSSPSSPSSSASQSEVARYGAIMAQCGEAATKVMDNSVKYTYTARSVESRVAQLRVWKELTVELFRASIRPKRKDKP